ncbi:MAG: haloacid dehalogenase type II, partial [Pseudomonadota bacterium]|nr:haloacid dehalogenase type II [Pseudomonadota bacterium]
MASNGDMPLSRPIVVAFDMIETIFSLESLRAPFIAAGLPRESLEVWFAHTLRDAFALEVTEVYQPFREIAASTLQSLLVRHRAPHTPADVDHLLSRFSELEPHPDAAEAFARLRSAGIRLVGLT